MQATESPDRSLAPIAAAGGRGLRGGAAQPVLSIDHRSNVTDRVIFANRPRLTAADRVAVRATYRWARSAGWSTVDARDQARRAMITRPWAS